MNKELIVKNRYQYIIENINQKYNWLKENTDYNIIYIALQGSQNYEMDVYTTEYMSDIDVKAICVPNLEDIVKGKKIVSHTYVMADNSHIDVKDIRLYKDLWRKSNPQFLEILFTKFYICNNDKFEEILGMADRIANANKNRLLSCIKGMQMEKYKALKHPYPTIKDKIDKYGYDPKQAHHIYRLLCFAKDIFVNNITFRESLIPSEQYKQKCLDLKLIPKSLNKIEDECLKYVERLKNIADEYRSNNDIIIDKECYELLENIIYSIIIDEIKERLNESTAII